MKMVKRIVVLSMMCLIMLCIAKPVQVEAAKPKLNKTKLTLTVGQKKNLKVKNTKKKVKWSSSKKAVASVTQKGIVTAKKAGTAKIYAKVAGKKLTCKVTVKAKKVEKPVVQKPVVQEPSVTGKLIVPRKGTNNYYATIQISNKSGNDIEIMGFADLNGFGCQLNGELTSTYILPSGYYCKLNYYRAILPSLIYESRYNDMYLDGWSEGWVRFEANDKMYTLYFDAQGNSYVEPD